MRVIESAFDCAMVLAEDAINLATADFVDAELTGPEHAFGADACRDAPNDWLAYASNGVMNEITAAAVQAITRLYIVMQVYLTRTVI